MSTAQELFGKMDPTYRYRLREEIASMCDSRFRNRYQGKADVIRRGVRTLPEFRGLAECVIDFVAVEAGHGP